MPLGTFRFADAVCLCKLYTNIFKMAAISYFCSQITLILPTKFRVSWSLGSGEEAQNRFSRWQPWRPSLISDRNEFTYFDLQVTPMLPIDIRVNRPRDVGGVGF